MDFNFSQNTSRNESIFQTIANDIIMSSDRRLKRVLRTLHRFNREY
jgi:hypothetical protein